MTDRQASWTVDQEADAAYLKLSSAPIDRTLNFSLINIDLDAAGSVVGVELMTLTPWPD